MTVKETIVVVLDIIWAFVALFISIDLSKGNLKRQKFLAVLIYLPVFVGLLLLLEN